MFQLATYIKSDQFQQIQGQDKLDSRYEMLLQIQVDTPCPTLAPRGEISKAGFKEVSASFRWDQPKDTMCWNMWSFGLM